MGLPVDADNPFPDEDPFAGPPDPRLPEPEPVVAAPEAPSAPIAPEAPLPSDEVEPSSEEIRRAFDQPETPTPAPTKPPDSNGAPGAKPKGPAPRKRVQKDPADLPPPVLPPQDLAAEAAVLGSIVLNEDCGFELFRLLSPADFYRESHRLLFAAMLSLHERAEAIDSLTLVAALRSRGELVTVGGTEAVVALLDGTPSSANWEHYAKLVRAKSLRRAQIVEADRLRAAAYDETSSDDPVAILSEASTRLLEIAHGATDEKVECIGGGELLDLKIDRPRLILGTDDLKAARPLAEQQLMVVGGPPKLGKSLLVAELAVEACKQNGRWLDIPVHGPFRTLIIEAEGGLDLVQDWLSVMAKNLDKKALNLIRIPKKLPKIDLTKPKSVMQLRRIIEGEESRLTWLDPFFRLHRADENDNNEMRDVMAALEELRAYTKNAMIMVHHVARLIMENQKGRATVRLRGGSVVDADLDSLAMLDYADEDAAGATYYLYWDIRRGPKPPNQIIYRDDDTLHHRAAPMGAVKRDKNGRRVTGAAAAPAGGGDGARVNPTIRRDLMEFLAYTPGCSTEVLAAHLGLTPKRIKDLVTLIGFSITVTRNEMGDETYRLAPPDEQPPPNHPDRKLFGGRAAADDPYRGDEGP